MDLNIIKQSIRKWNQVRKTELGLTFLTSGFGLEVSKAEYDKWVESIKDGGSIKFIHLYIGILEFETVFYLVDDITDRNEDYKINENLFIKNFTKQNIEKKGQKPEKGLVKKTSKFTITDIKAAERAFRWFFFSNDWSSRKIKTLPTETGNNVDDSMVRVFTIPFSDFEKILKNADEKVKAFLFFGLRKMIIKGGYSEERDEIEVLLCSEKGFNQESTSEDLTTPIPPYSAQGKNLNLL